MSLTRLNEKKKALEQEAAALKNEMYPLIQKKFAKRLMEKTAANLDWSYSFMSTDSFDAQLNCDHADYNYFRKWMEALGRRSLTFKLDDEIEVTIHQEIGYYRYFFSAYFRDGILPWNSERVVRYILDKGWKFNLAVARKKLEQDLAFAISQSKRSAKRVLAIQSILNLL